MTAMFQVKDEYIIDATKQDFTELFVRHITSLKDCYMVTYMDLDNSGVTLQRRFDKEYYELRFVSEEA